MSSSQNKKNRGYGGLNNPGGKGRNDKNADNAYKTARIAGITAIVVAVLFAASLFLNSSFLRQKMTAVKIDDVNYSLTDYSFYYKNIYMQYMQNFGGSDGMGAGMLPDTQKSLKSQVYDEETGQTWADFFKQMALDQLESDNTIYKEAQKAGYQLSEEDRQKIDEEIANVQGAAATYGYADLDSYLRAVYGKGMNESYFRKATERTYLISTYVEYVRDAFMYTPEDIEAFYTENKNNYDTFTYRYFLVEAGEPVIPNDADEATVKAAEEEALAAAGVKAGEIAGTITDEQSFIEAARSYDSETYQEDDTTLRVYKGELLGATYGDWLKDPARTSGQVSTFESTNGYYVVQFISRSDNHYQTVNAQMILVAPEQIDSTLYPDDDAAYDAAVEEARKAAENTANDINGQWQTAGATQEKLTELAEANADLISPYESGLKENIYKTQMPEEVEGWLYDTARKPGDHTLVYSEATGYYILYFVGPGEQYSDVLADTGKRQKDLADWKEALPVVEPQETWVMIMATV
jgi:hypothetical protein